MIKTMYLKSSLIVIGLFLSFSSFAQNSVNGIISDASNKQPLIGTNVALKDGTAGVLSDLDGSFILTSDKPLPWTVVVSYIGYVTQEIQVTENQALIEVALEPGVTFSTQVVVSASRVEEVVTDAPAAISIVEGKILQIDAMASPFLSLRNTTGVDIAQYGVSSGQINLRGRSTAFITESYIISDNRSILIPSFAFLQYGQQPIDAIDLDRIEVVKGPGGALYGPGVESGVVHFISKSPFKEQGTSISTGIGNQNQNQYALRHAGVSENRKFGYKITGFYRTATEFTVDTSEAAAKERLATYPSHIRSALSGDTITDVIPNYDILNIGIQATLEYRFNAKTKLIAIGGYGKSDGMFRTPQGEGYMTVGRPFAQLRYESGGFSAQSVWSKQMGSDATTWIYAAGVTNVNVINQYESSVQYQFDALDKKLNVITGGDYKTNIIDTEGTINGRFEDEDDYAIYGAFAQLRYNVTDKLKILGAARVDRFTALSSTSVSPRVAAIYSPGKNQTFRATWNRAVGAPPSLNLYSDFAVANRGAFLVWLNAGQEPITFENQQVYSFITQSVFPDANFPLNIAYGAATQGIAASGQLPESLVNYLSSVVPDIAGTTLGVQTSTPLARNKMKASQTSMYELGYKGFFGEKLGISIDAYYIDRRNNLTGTTVASPLIVYPTAGDDLATAVAAGLNADSLAQYGLTPAAVAGIYKGAIESLTMNNGAPSPLGLVSSDQSPDGKTLDAAFYNIEQIDYFGLDLEVKYYLTKDFMAHVNYSWVSQNYWEKAKISETNIETPFSLNQPSLKLRGGLEYLPNTGFLASAYVRHVGAWTSVNGSAWSGEVAASTVFDLSLGYAFNDKFSVNATGSNLFNAAYRPLANAPIIGRLWLVKLNYTIK